jgi:conjugal transfer ATP-binding protein TraC
MSQLLNKNTNTDYTALLPHAGNPVFSRNDAANKGKGEKHSFFGDFFARIFGSVKKDKKWKDIKPVSDSDQAKLDAQNSNASLQDQLKALLHLPDAEYSDKLLTSKLRSYLTEVEKEYVTSIADYKSHIAPSYWEATPSMTNLSGLFGKTYYAHNYPSYMEWLWTRDMLSFFDKWDMTRFIYPEDDASIQSVLKRRSTQLKAELNDLASKGITIDTDVQLEYRDVEEIRQKIATREERYFEVSHYFSIFSPEKDKLAEEAKKYEQKVSGYGIRVKPASHRMDEGLLSTMPLGIDDLGITRSMVTSSLAGSFPFIANDLIDKTGILYGANEQSGSLVIFDRFSGKLPNANSVVLASSGAGKSFTVKLEILRYLLQGIPTIVIDPENEYKSISDKVGGTYINIAMNSQQYINPFDLPPRLEDSEYGKGDLLRSQIANLMWLVSVLVGKLTAQEEALLDKALQSTYALKEITLEDDNYDGKKVPIMQDLINVLEGTQWGGDLAVKLSKFATGTFGKLFNNETNVNLDAPLTVFSIRDVEDALKTPAMYNVLNYIWATIRSKKIKRLLIVDEAWIMMKHEISAQFLFGMVKRARKYGLGITTISQDIEDFVNSQYGKPIITNSAMQLLLKQSTASIKTLDALIGLSEAEKQRLVSAGIGEWLMFAWPQHVAIKIIASPQEKEFITTDVK